HTCRYFMKFHIFEYTNDFAEWVGENLEERTLSELLSAIDPFELGNMAKLRDALMRIIDRYLDQFSAPRDAIPGNEFYFSEAISVVFRAGVRARNLAEFLTAIQYVDSGSIYYHFYEARIRHGTDDFSTWFEEALNKKELARTVRVIDPFMHSTEGIRKHIIEIVEKEVREDMEGAVA
ncbi:MAG TPA: DUF5752 family protein, partial [Syntrophorhabdaceae bacterium]|nr:DUF5752 family protein [Syntrophorhabdaceae bacterium]